MSPTSRVATMHVGSVPAVRAPTERSVASTEEWTTDPGSAHRATLPELIAAQAALTPSAPAVVCGKSVMTYRELDNAANRLARRLLETALAPNRRVAVLLDRSTELIVALLAILKAGNAYVPLDPAYPPERLGHVLDDVQPSAIISKAGLIDTVTHAGITTMLIDSELTLSDSADIAPPVNVAHPEAVAYVIYTSGSTGVPKGVQIQHHSVVNLLQSLRRKPGLSAADVLLAVTTVSFDIAVLEIFLPLSVGAQIVLAQEQDVIDGAALCRLMQRHSVTVLQATPITWQLLIASGWRNAGLKMLCGGEALSRPLAEELLKRGGELWNMYGPTETTVWSSALRIVSGDDPVLLGPPIENTFFHILDEQLQPVAPGDSGELFIGGEGVALGYIGLPDLNAEKFLADSFSKQPGARLYRTGDLVKARRYHRQECLEFLGRKDSQVKLRGHRIELGEIEATLARHDAVAQAVAAIGRQNSEPTIWAYVVLKSKEPELSAELSLELHYHIAKYLPLYMQPSAIVVLTQLPQTPNGKLDRKALPPPQATSNDAAAVQREPLIAEAERKLMAIWHALLGHTQLDVNANFFFVGGRSLSAAQLLDRIESAFGVRLTLAALYAAPSIAEQASLLRHWDERHYDFRQKVRLNAQGAQTPLLAIHNTGVYAYHLAHLLGPNQPLTALQLFDPSPRENFPDSVESIAAEYVQLIKQVQPRPPYQLMGWCLGGVLAYEIARQLTDRGDAVPFVGMIDSWAPGHLQRLSKLRAWLSDHSFRTQLILTDWRKVRSGQQSMMDFLRNRVVLKRLLRVAGDVHSQPIARMFADRHLSGAHYDRWLAHYLEDAAAGYTPKIYAGKVRLLRSSLEPSGCFLDPLMGWGAFVPSGIETAVLEGDHFTVFRGIGLQQLANILSVALAPSAGVASAE